MLVPLLRSASARIAPADPAALLAAGSLSPARPPAASQARRDEGTEWCERALRLQRQERTEEAAAAFREALRLEPRRPLAWYALGLTLRRLGRQQEALAAYQEAVRIAPGFAPAWYRLARLHEAQEDFPDAIRAYREAVRCQPDHAVAWYDLAILCREEGRLGEAVEAFLATLRLKPRFTDAWLGLGLSYFKQGNRAGVLEVYQELARLDTTTAESFARQCVEALPEPAAPPPLHREGQPAHARRPLPAAGLHPLAEAWYEMGVLHRKRGEAREAISGFLEAVRFDPDHAKAWLSLAALYRACGREADALDALRELLRLKPGLAAAWCDLGNLHARRGQHEKAGTAFRQAIQVKPEYAGAWLGLGRSCVALGNASGLAEVLHTLRTLAAPLADLLEREAGTPPRVAEPAQPAASGPSARSSPRPAPPRTAASFEPWLKSLRRAKAGAKAPARPRARSRRASARIA